VAAADGEVGGELLAVAVAVMARAAERLQDLAHRAYLLLLLRCRAPRHHHGGSERRLLLLRLLGGAVLVRIRVLALLDLLLLLPVLTFLLIRLVEP
jgi:hypothetical protein